MRGYIAQTKAEGLRLVRSPFFLLFSILMPITFYCLFVMLNGADAMIGSVPWAAYSLMSMTAFSLIGTAAGQFGIRIAYERRDGWLKQLRLTPLSTHTWILAKITSHLIVHVFIIIAMFTLSAVLFDTGMSITRFITCGLWLLIGSLPFLALGMLIGVIKSVDVVTAVSNLVYMGISVAGGLWMPMEVFPKWMQSVGTWLPSHAFANGAWGLLAGNAIRVTDMLLLLGYGIVFVVLSVYIMNKREAV